MGMVVTKSDKPEARIIIAEKWYGCICGINATEHGSDRGGKLGEMIQSHK